MINAQFPLGTPYYFGSVGTQGGIYLGDKDSIQIFIPNARSIGTLKPFNVVKEKIALAFDQPGEGIQLRAMISEVANRFATVDDLIRFKYLKDPKVNP